MTSRALAAGSPQGLRALGRTLGHRGHLREAYALVGDLFPDEFVHYALAGTISAERAHAATPRKE